MLASATGFITIEGEEVPGSFGNPPVLMLNTEMVLLLPPLATNRKTPELSLVT